MQSVPDPGSISTSHPERLFAHIIDHYVAGNQGTFDALVRAHWDTIVRWAHPIDPRNPRHTGGSWNIVVLAMAVAVLSGRDHTYRGVFQEYLSRQLDPDNSHYHGGFMGKEALSTLYCWPPFCVLLVYAHTLTHGNEKLTSLCEAYLRVYGLILSLAAYPARYKTGRSAIFCAGNRTDVAWLGSPILSVMFRYLIGLDVLADRRDQFFEDWPVRVCRWAQRRAAFSRIFDGSEEQTLKAHHRRRDQAKQIAGMLAAHRVRLRADFHFLGWPDGVVSATAKNLHGSTPPIAAAGWVNGRGVHASPYPKGFRGSGKRRVGNHTIDIRSDRIVVRTVATWAGLGPEGGTVNADGSVTTTLHFPDGPPLYHVVIGPQGVRMVGHADQTSDDTTDTPDTPDTSDTPVNTTSQTIAERIGHPLAALVNNQRLMASGLASPQKAYANMRNMVNTFRSHGYRFPEG